MKTIYVKKRGNYKTRTVTLPALVKYDGRDLEQKPGRPGAYDFLKIPSRQSTRSIEATA